jgi:hypothetical protein
MSSPVYVVYKNRFAASVKDSQLDIVALCPQVRKEQRRRWSAKILRGFEECTQRRQHSSSDYTQITRSESLKTRARHFYQSRTAGDEERSEENTRE